jgi:hypothetical protein
MQHLLLLVISQIIILHLQRFKSRAGNKKGRIFIRPQSVVTHVYATGTVYQKPLT